MPSPMFESYSARSAVCPNPVFVIGAPRSGTTVLAAALAQHSDFWTSDESFFMFQLFGMDRAEHSFRRWSSRPCSSWLRTEQVTREEFLGFLGLGLNALFSSRSQGKRWIDHTPHHGLMAAVLADMFPGAAFLHILRDGRQVVNSMVHVARTLATNELEQMRSANFLPPWEHNFREACKVWKRDAEAAEEFCRHCPGRCLTIRHDRLEDDPSETLRQTLAFLKAPYDEAPAAFVQTRRINSSFQGKADPEMRRRPWQRWTAEQRRTFVEEAGDALVRFGFATAEELGEQP